MPAEICVVEDDPAIRRGVCDALRLTGYTVTEAADGTTGLAAASRSGIDLVLLDLLLPGLDGLEVLEALRKVRPTLPVIVLTARGGVDDRVRGLKMGADDYVVKPFSARELLARVEAVLRRSLGRPCDLPAARFGNVHVDFNRREVNHEDGREDLSETEAVLLQFLVSHRDRAVPREELLVRVWGLSPGRIETRTIDMHVARLRAKLRSPDAVVTVRSVGYMAGPDWKAEKGTT